MIWGQIGGARALGLDERTASPYLAAMANRLFITLLALLTGLAAQVGPAQARGCAVSSAEIGAVAGVAVAQRQHVSASLVRRPAELRDRCGADFCRAALPREVRRAAAVLTGIDRARE